MSNVSGLNSHCSLPPTYGDESYGYKTGGISKINLNAGCSLPPTPEYKQWPSISIWEKENQGSDEAAFIGNANLNTIA